MNPLLVRIVLGLADALGILSVIQGLLKSVSQEKIPFLIESTVVATSLNVGSPSYGLAALHTQIQGVKDDLDASVASLTLQLVNLTDGTTPVSLPVTPPSGYGGASTSDIADQVWNGAIATIPSTPGDALLQVARSLNVTSLYDMPLYVGIFRVSRIDWSAPGIYQSGVGYPTFDPTGVLVSDTLLSCLTRQNPDWTCGNPWGPQSYVGLDWNGVSSSHYTTIIDEAGFKTLKESLGLLPPSLLAPIWPGSALATLGTSVALDRTVTLTEAKDGVIVTLTGVPPGKPTYVLGGLTATAHIGQIAFVADNGAAEYPQNLSFASEIYVPLALVGASAVVLRTIPGVAGTVQAWTRTP